MPKIISVSTSNPPFQITQNETMEFARELFSNSFKDIERLLTAFQNGQIEKRHFVKGLDWFKEEHTLEEKNNAYVNEAVSLGVGVIEKCLNNPYYLTKAIPCEDIEAIFMVSSTGIATPSIEARIMNQLPFNSHTKRIPIWGLGCAGGASGLSRAYEYCLAFPKAKALVVTIELCSLTFQKNDHSKSNLIGTSLFADGVACALVIGDQVANEELSCLQTVPRILNTQSSTMKDSLDVMGWELKDSGLHVVFSKSIPSLIEKWLRPNVEHFLKENNLSKSEIDHFIAHPGGIKVLEAYLNALEMDYSKINHSFNVLKQNGNMSSATVLYVLDKFMQEQHQSGEWGIIAALGPGFSSELLLVRWS